MRSPALRIAQAERVIQCSNRLASARLAASRGAVHRSSAGARGVGSASDSENPNSKTLRPLTSRDAAEFDSFST